MTIEEIKKEYRTGDYQTVAKKAGVHANTVMNHVHGRHRPKPDTERLLLQAWADVIGERLKFREELRKRLSNNQ